MSKIICDICGTSYPETAGQCPICGCIRPGDVQRVTNEVKTDGKVSTGYTYIKGGRFSKTNVKKRSQAQVRSAAETREDSPKNEQNGSDKGNVGLVITAVVLLLAIIGVVIFIAVRFFMPFSDPNHGESTGTVNVGELVCTDIKLDTDTILFEQIGEARLLQVTVEPRNTTDSISFRSLDETVVTVNAVGKITVVGEGTTKIVITCGAVTKECTVTCQLPTETTLIDPTATEESTGSTEQTGVIEEFRLNRVDMTFSTKGDKWNLYEGEIDKSLITWTSDDETVVTVEDGVAYAKGPGMTNVHAEYMGQKVSCIVRCVFKESTGVEGSGGVSEDGGGSGAVTGTVTGKVSNDYLNVRSGPGLSYSKVGLLSRGDAVTITEQQVADGYTWGKISNGWIALDYVTLD